MAADLSQYSKSELAAGFARMRGVVKRANEKTKLVAARGVNSGLTVAAGYGVGVLKNRMGDENGNVLIPGTNVQADLAAGVVLALAGVAGMGGNRADEIAAVGSGMLAGYAAVAGYKFGLPGEGR